MKPFVIPFYGLKPGIHTFDFFVDHAFFEAFESNLVEDARFDVVLSLEKLTTMLILRFSASGELLDYCDRCGEAIQLQMNAEDEIFVKFGDTPYEQTDEVIVVSHETHEIDVAQMIYEMIVLNIPSKKAHDDPKDCNQDVIEKLKAHLRDNDEDEDTDPRWEALKKLK